MARHFYFVSVWKTDWYPRHLVAPEPPFACYTRKENLIDLVAPGDVVWGFTKKPPTDEWCIGGRLVVHRVQIHNPLTPTYDSRYAEFRVQILADRSRSIYSKPFPLDSEMFGLLVRSWNQTQKQMCEIRSDNEIGNTLASAAIHMLENCWNNDYTPLVRHNLEQRSCQQ